TERFDRQSYWDRNYTWGMKPDTTWSWSQVEQAIGKTLPQPIWMTNGIHGRVAVMGSQQYPMRTLQQLHADHFGPRIGVAYQVLPRTVVRASYGMIWLTTTGNWFLGSARWNVGYGDSARLAQSGTGDGGLTYPLTFSNPMPGGAGYVPLSLDVDRINRAVLGNWWLSETADFSSGYEHSVQLSIQREFGSGPNSWVTEIAYSGTMGRGLPTWLGVGEHILPDAYHKIGNLGASLLQNVPNPFYNQLPAGTARSGKMIPLGQLYELNPLWSQITTTGDPLGTSNYNSGYIKVEHRFARGFGVLANYTLSKLMEDTGGIDHSTSGSARYGQAGLGRKDVYSVSLSDYRHKAVFNYSFELPFGKGKRLLNDTSSTGGQVLNHLAGGWVVAGTTTLRSGTYLNVYGPSTLWWIAGQANNSGRSERIRLADPRVDYNNKVSGHQSLLGAPNFVPYLNVNAFRLAQATPDLLEIGDVPEGFSDLMSPGFSQWDLSLMKNFYLGKESRYLQLRFEAQNLLNHMNCGGPTTDITSSSFGIITGQNGSSRQAMIAAKLYF
ncbi:MAG: hypothetical protein IT158_21590, partial [Bryobacterales bacterium]|nr:hypothetical protein [Bryobacterales bacterium]